MKNTGIVKFTDIRIGISQVEKRGDGYLVVISAHGMKDGESLVDFGARHLAIGDTLILSTKGKYTITNQEEGN